MTVAAREKRFVSAVVLAAGSSTRFAGDTPKQLTAIDGTSMVRRVAQAALASKASEVIVVTGFQQARVASEVKGLAVHTVYNRRFQQGLSTSVKTGLWAVSDRSSAVLFIPCDQPHLDTTSLDLLVEALPARARVGAGALVSRPSRRPRAVRPQVLRRAGRDLGRRGWPPDPAATPRRGGRGRAPGRGAAARLRHRRRARSAGRHRLAARSGARVPLPAARGDQELPLGIADVPRRACGATPRRRASPRPSSGWALIRRRRRGVWSEGEWRSLRELIERDPAGLSRRVDGRALRRRGAVPAQDPRHRPAALAAGASRSRAGGGGFRSRAGRGCRPRRTAATATGATSRS